LYSVLPDGCHLNQLNDVTKTARQERTQGGGVWSLTPSELDILQKLYYLRKGDYLFSYTFYLLICRLNANITE